MRRGAGRGSRRDRRGSRRGDRMCLLEMGMGVSEGLVREEKIDKKLVWKTKCWPDIVDITED